MAWNLVKWTRLGSLPASNDPPVCASHVGFAGLQLYAMVFNVGSRDSDLGSSACDANTVTDELQPEAAFFMTVETLLTENLILTL